MSEASMSGAQANGVCWLELELNGFGVHDQANFNFPEGLGVFVGPNETGKSTALAGLTAVVFGLPTSNDPLIWGQARYRSYRSTGRFAGRVVFRARDGLRYEIRRNFETHEVSLRLLDGEEAGTLFAGRHNPGARKGTGKYEELLASLVGIVSDGLFRQTFSIEQPLRGESGLSGEVATLLAGSGGSSHGDALDRLKAEIVARTRYTSRHGLPNDMRADRELEKLEGEIVEHEQRIEAGRASADGLQRIQLDLAELEAGKRELLDEVERLERLEGSARDWLVAEENYRREQRQLRELSVKVERAGAFEREIERLSTPTADEALEVEYDWSEGRGSAVRHLEQCRADAREVLRDYRNFQEAQAASRAARERLAPLALLADAPDELLSELSERERRRSDLEEAIRRAREDLELLEQQVRANDPNNGYEDVLDLDDERLGELRLLAAPRRKIAPWLALGGAALGVLIALLLALGTPLLALLALTLALPAGLGGWLLDRRPDPVAEEAKEKLGRHAEWQRRVDSAGPRPDLTSHQERLEQAQRELQGFLERTEPYRNEYPDLAAAVAELREARLELQEHHAAALRYARDLWGTSPDQADSVDPVTIEGSWQRVARFVALVGPGAATVGELAKTLSRMEEREQWRALERDAESWDKRSAARATREAELDTARRVLRGILEAEGVGSLEDLRDKLAARQTEAIAERNEFKAICEGNPELPRYDEAEERRHEVVAARDDYSAARADAEKRLRALEAREHELLRERSSRQGENPPNIATLEIELSGLRERAADLELEIEAFALAYSTLQEAVREYQDAYLERLSELTTRYFRAFSGRRERRVAFDDTFAVQVLDEGGVELQPSRLSQGAQDQLALAARLAIADMIGDDVPLPLVFDDPFGNCDEERLERIAEALRRVAEERQVLLLSHDEGYLGWGAAVAIGEVKALEPSGR